MADAAPIDPSRRGPLLSLASAALFGVSAPLSKLLLPWASPMEVAGLLYLGAGLGLLVLPLIVPSVRRRSEAALTVRDLPLMVGIVLLGGILAPVLLLTGLERVSGVVGSLLLNLEAPLTIFVAVMLFREHLGRREIACVTFVLLGAVALGFRPGDVRVDPLGLLAVAGACLAWAFDNNLTQRLSGKDPVAITRVKCLVAGGVNLVLASVLGSSLPGTGVLVASMLLGLASYGVSLVIATVAMRRIGAARHAAYFASAPFVGAVLAVPLLGEVPRWTDVLGMVFMALGLAALLRERHGHSHVHEALEHEHAHRHDAHHQHDHPAGIGPGEPHVHVHRHDQLEHDHEHASDLHHRHAHPS